MSSPASERERSCSTALSWRLPPEGDERLVEGLGGRRARKEGEEGGRGRRARKEGEEGGRGSWERKEGE